MSEAKQATKGDKERDVPREGQVPTHTPAGSVATGE